MNSENYANDELDEIINSSDIGADNADKVKSAAKKYSDRLNKDREHIRSELSTEYLSTLSKALGVDVKSFNTEDLESAIKNAISESDTVKKAEKIITDAKEKETQAILADNLSKIKGLNPSVNSIDDVCKLDKYESIKAKVDKGYDLYDAYVSVYGFPSGGNNNYTKGALNGSTVPYTKPEIMSDGEYALYRKAFPGKTDKEIIELFRRDSK